MKREAHSSIRCFGSIHRPGALLFWSASRVFPRSWTARKLVSFAAVFLDVTQRSRQKWGVLHDIQKKAARETTRKLNSLG